MSTRLFSGIVLFLLLFGMTAFAVQQAKSSPATITVPDDYLTIQEAINNADNGDTVFVRNGTYDENIVLNRSLSLIGEDRNTTIIDGGLREETVVHVKAENVVIQGLTIQNSSIFSRGILLDYAGNSSIVDNNIMGNGYGVLVVGSPFTNVSANTLYGNVNYGIRVAGSYNVHISHNNIPYTTQFGISVEYCNSSYVYDNQVAQCRWGLRIRGSGVHIFSNSFVDNWDYAIYLRNASRNTIHKNNITRGGAIFKFVNSSENLIFHNNFINNTYQTLTWSNDTWDNGCEGNYWSNYNGTDLNGDGIGDEYLPWENVDHHPLMNLYWNPCDINHDLKVDMEDIGTSAAAFGTQPGDERWNCHADITGPIPLEPDGKVNMRDIGLIARNFGE